ncbi:hypothetical protein PFISCL1PPCAC_23318, partial [Pristionchus fissidentatus]
RLFPVKVDADSVPEVCSRRPRTIKDAERMEMRRSIVDARVKVRHDALELQLQKHLQPGYPTLVQPQPLLQQHQITRLHELSQTSQPIDRQPAVPEGMVVPKEEEKNPEEMLIPES